MRHAGDTSLLVQVVVGILQRCEARLLERMVAFLKVEVPQWRHDTLQVRPRTFLDMAVRLHLRCSHESHSEGGLQYPSDLPCYSEPTGVVFLVQTSESSSTGSVLEGMV